jgi:predicted PurR-regulated permease PerM
MEGTADRSTEATAQAQVPKTLTESAARPLLLADPERRRHARIQSGSLAVIAIGGVLTMMYLAKVVLTLILISVLIAFMLAPIVELLRRARMPRSVGALIAVLLICAAIAGVFRVSYRQADAFMSELPMYSGHIRSVLNDLSNRAERFRETTRNVLPEQKIENGTLTVRETSSWEDKLTTGAIGASEALLIAATIPFLVFFMLSWQDRVRSKSVMLFSPENRANAYTTLGLISHMLRGFIVGNAVIGLILGIVSTIAFWILGVPFFYVIGIISGFVSVLPYLGIVLAIVPPVVVSMGLLSAKSFIAIVAVVAISHLIALNLLYPEIIGRRVQLNPLSVILALLFWGWLWGAIGLILAIPLTAAIKIIFDHIESLRSWGNWLGE